MVICHYNMVLFMCSAPFFIHGGGGMAGMRSIQALKWNGEEKGSRVFMASEDRKPTGGRVRCTSISSIRDRNGDAVS